MKYLLLQDNNYYFRRKIPKTSQSYTFSLKSKNAKLASKVINLFLLRAEPLFQSLKSETSEDVMSNLETIIQLLENYKEEALIEYSPLEEARHKHLTCVSKSGKKRDGGHKKCIKKWLKIFEEAVYTTEDDIDKYFEEIFSRTGIDKGLLEGLTLQEQREVAFRTVKAERDILQEDYHRAKTFEAGHSHQKEQQAPMIYYQEQKSSKYYEKTAQELADSFLEKMKNETSELHKYEAPIKIFLSLISEKYLADVPAENMRDFVFVMKNLPPKQTAADKKLYVEYENDYLELANYVVDNKLKTVVLNTAMEKITNVSRFLNYAVDMERLDKNRLSVSPALPSRKEKEDRNEEEEEPRIPFTIDELNKLMKSTWYEKNLKKNLTKEQDRIYIPLIALMTGLRLTEVSQLYVNDILEENGIPYIRVDKVNPHQKLKNRSCKRKMPIPPKLIELGFLKYVNSLKEQNIERVFHQLGVNQRGFGKPFGNKFRNKNFRKEWLNEEELEEKGEVKVFHCFRHNFLTELEHYATPHKYSSLAGHKMGNYKYVHPPLDRLSEVINQITYDEIDFSNLIDAVNSIYED